MRLGILGYSCGGGGRWSFGTGGPYVYSFLHSDLPQVFLVAYFEGFSFARLLITSLQIGQFLRFITVTF